MELTQLSLTRLGNDFGLLIGRPLPCEDRAVDPREDQCIYEEDGEEVRHVVPKGFAFVEEVGWLDGWR